MSAAQEPHRHHFVPEFYLSEWNEPGTGKFWLYLRDPTGEMSFRHRSGRATGFEKYLYSYLTDGLDFRNTKSAQLESNFFSPLDSAASIVHQKLVHSGVNSISNEERMTWSLFVNSLLSRSPEKINRMQSVATTAVEDSMLALQQTSRAWSSCRFADPILERLDKSAVSRNLALNAIVSEILDRDNINYICSMQWATVQIPQGPDHFLTSDRPLVVNVGRDMLPVIMISLSLSPKLLLLMNKEDADEGLLKLAAVAHNALLIRQSTRHLFSYIKLEDGYFFKYQSMIKAMMPGHKNTPTISEETPLKKHTPSD